MIRGRTTMIPVILKDGTCRQVFPEVLDGLLDANRVMLFRRSNGWVLIGHDPVRGAAEAASYSGEERRAVQGGQEHRSGR